MRRIEALVVLGMNPWRHSEINDTVRFLTAAASWLDRLYINPPPGLRNTRLGSLPSALSGSWREERLDGISLFDPPLGFAPVGLGLKRRADRFAARRFSRMLGQRYGSDWRDKVLVYVPSWSFTQTDFIHSLDPRYLLFHILDDSLAFPQVKDDPRVLQENLRFFKYLMEKSGLVIAVSEVLAQKYGEAYQRKIPVIKNGVDLKHFHTDHAVVNPAADAELSGIRDPILMYIGSINSWVDLDLLLRLSRERPDYSLVLIGHCYEAAIQVDTWRELLSRPNLHWLGSRPYFQLPRYLKYASALLLPRTDAEHSRASDPLKLYEYLATGRPVVSTALPAVDEFQGLVYLSRTPDEFIQAADSALSQHTPEKARRQVTAAAGHSWVSRFKEISSLLEQELEITLNRD
ncbi:MAG: glycosyltransferase [Firmicutes bacterium]|nr:glycosyltransferase [Bacillota bacterium]